MFDSRDTRKIYTRSFTKKTEDAVWATVYTVTHFSTTPTELRTRHAQALDTMLVPDAKVNSEFILEVSTDGWVLRQTIYRANVNDNWFKEDTDSDFETARRYVTRTN